MYIQWSMPSSRVIIYVSVRISLTLKILQDSGAKRAVLEQALRKTRAGRDTASNADLVQVAQLSLSRDVCGQVRMANGIAVAGQDVDLTCPQWTCQRSQPMKCMEVECAVGKRLTVLLC